MPTQAEKGQTCHALHERDHAFIILSRTALGAFLRAAQEMREHGTFDFAKDAASPREISSMFKS